MRIVTLVLLLSAAAAAVPERGSPALVRQFVSAMEARRLDAIAVPDRYEDGRFIAALVYPDVQVLVVSGRASSPEALLKQIAERRFRDAYLDLNRGASDGRVFIHDMGANGLQEGGGEGDIYYEGDARTLFDGNWTAQSLTEADYQRKEEEADLRYSRALALLLDGVRRIPQTE
jgi:hypothetical protein